MSAMLKNWMGRTLHQELIRGSLFLALLPGLVGIACKKSGKELPKNRSVSVQQVPFKVLDILPDGVEPPSDMVWIPGGTFEQGASVHDTLAMGHERPLHRVAVDGFFMDVHEVTNAAFSAFVAATGYRTVAEREIQWEEMKKQLPPNTQKPHDSILQPGSLVFRKTRTSVSDLYNYSQWWEWRIGANWRAPKGPGSSIEGKEDHPVVHVAHEDVLAYCQWAGRRLPTEAEWEYAAKGGLEGALFTWGTDREALGRMANTWEGEFPVTNTKADGYERSAPVMSYPPNGFGLYDMAGNVWEWTSDWYHQGYYAELAGSGMALNPQGAKNPYNPMNPLAQEKVLKGGSFLCSDTYCASYRPSARMGTTVDSGMEHLGFRTVIGLSEYLKNRQE